ncbi:hypothetical protein Tco_0945274 [Tanacetum coccineum]
MKPNAPIWWVLSKPKRTLLATDENKRTLLVTGRSNAPFLVITGWRWWRGGCGDSDGGVRVAVAAAWRWLLWCVTICGDDVDGMEMVVGITMVLVMLLVRWCGGGAWRVGDDVGGDAWR